MAPAPRAEAGGNSPTPSTDTANVNASLVDAMEEVNMKTDEATATANTDEDTSNEEYNPDNLSASTIKHRAKSHWNFIKSLHIAQKEQHSQRQLFKMGENTSMTTSEATFLNMIAKQRLSVDHDYHTKSAEDEDTATDTAVPTTDPLAVSGRTHFSHLVQAAVAKERLRDAISARISDLSGAEAKFLTKLVENKSVSLEALENAVHVLDNDPMYNEKLRMEQSFVMSFTAGGLSEEMIAMLEEEDSEEEGEGGSNCDMKDEKKDVVKPMNRRQSTRMQRRSSAIKCSALFEKSLSEKALSERRNSENHEMIASTNGRRRKIGRRGSSTMELGLWNLSKGVADGEESIGLDESSRSRLRRASVVEKSMWQIVHGESIEHVDSEMQQSLDELEGEDGLPTKAINKGDAMDPLLMAVPVEKSPYMLVKKELDEKEKAKPAATQVRLADLLADHQARKEKLNQAESSSFLNDDSQEMPSQLLACCGVDPNSFLTDIYGANYDAETTVEGNTNEEKRVGEKDSLASKKEYLHLKEEEKTNIDRHAHLSTWLGTPEDYPILGLKKTVTADETSLLDDIIHEESESCDGLSDPLEPHVLSPLLMKCLREHLPYALREENFWLKYSLVRDGASLECIFSSMRHSQHTILAIETCDGEVFGSFTASPWRDNGNQFYGSCEAFTWMLRKSRLTPDGEDTCRTLDEYILRESSLEVYNWNPKDGNRNVQLSNTKKLFVGGGNPDIDEDEFHHHESAEEAKSEAVEWGMALALDRDLLRGTSSRCATFASDPLIDKSRHEGSDVFEIMNIEIWALTPCMNEEMAEELELGRTFVMGGFHK